MIAQTIAQQLGVPTLALLGAHTLVDLEDGLQFRIRGCSKINVIQIILDPCFQRSESEPRNAKKMIHL